MSTSRTPSARGALETLAPFQGLPEATIGHLAEISSLRRYRRDMFVFGEGEPAELFCFVHQGAVKVYKTTSDGQEQTLHILQPNDLFAVAGFVVGGVYPGTAQTLEDSWIGCIRNAALRTLAQSDTALAWSLLTLFARRLTGTSQQVLDLSTRDAAGKLAAALLQLAGAREDQATQSVTVEMHLTHRDLAQLIGASRETVTRLLGDFRQDGAVEPIAGGRLNLHPEVLRRYIG